ncbi:MAG TPA: DUF998 domain-containing protein [Dehalococcoidia bacterium]|nr:DUF998 domain-containing protein [Dehalococcoidia bacterium]
MSQSGQAGASRSLVISYLGLRKAIGVIGVTLPFVLVIGKYLIEGPSIQSSISSYYHTAMRDVFVGSLCAMAIFLMSYRGYERKDDIAGDLACVFAIGVALFPTKPAAVDVTSLDKVFGFVHFGFAAALFLTLAFFSLYLFPKTAQGMTPTPQKRQRNLVYRICGCIMLGCIALIIIVSPLSRDSQIKQLAPVFWLEAVALVAFGVSWFTKGEGILKDREI